MLDEATKVMIEQFGEEVEVIQGDSYEAEDSDNPIYFENKPESEQNVITTKARVIGNPSEEVLTQYGFDQEAETTIYFDEDLVDEGTEIRHNGSIYVVSDVAVQQAGNGPYRWVVGCKRKK